MNLLIHIKSLIISKIIILSKRSQICPPQKDEKKNTKKTTTHYMTEFMYSTRKWKLVYSDRQQRSGCLGNRDREEGEITEA